MGNLNECCNGDETSSINKQELMRQLASKQGLDDATLERMMGIKKSDKLCFDST